MLAHATLAGRRGPDAPFVMAAVPQEFLERRGLHRQSRNVTIARTATTFPFSVKTRREWVILGG